MVVGEKRKNMQTTELSEPAAAAAAVLNWDRVIHKGVRTKDGEPLGYIAAEDGECIYVLSSGFREYRIPKWHVMEFNGAEVLLGLQFEKVGLYEIH
jgi:hypothetical protein